jgi:hypothetical protein
MVKFRPFLRHPFLKQSQAWRARAPKSCPELELVGDPRLKIQCAIADGGD